jgi:hypothetical protein
MGNMMMMMTSVKFTAHSCNTCFMPTVPVQQHVRIPPDDVHKTAGAHQQGRRHKQHMLPATNIKVHVPSKLSQLVRQQVQ